MTVTNGGRVFYDGDCAFCVGWARRIERTLRRNGIEVVPFDMSGIGTSSSFYDEMIVEFPNGRRQRGADAVVGLARYIWWLWPLWILAKMPGTMPVLREAYRFVAATRHCISGACRTSRRTVIASWLPLMLLPPVVIALRGFFADWVFMWLLAFAVFFGCKWLTWHRADRSSASRIRSLTYLLAWPGMDAAEFLAKTTLERVRLADWIRATGKTVLGAGLLMFAANSVTRSPLLAGWVGMAGAVLILHFGTFYLLSLTYRAAGIAANPLMRSPGLAVSLSDFWANRWNTGFNKLAHNFLFLPLARRAGGAWAIFFVFIASGMVHDLAISLPARGGYGLPTAYFALQGMAVLLEKSRAGAAFGLGRGWRGWLFMLVVTVSPTPILFHSAFVKNVVLPMLQAIGGIWGKS